MEDLWSASIGMELVTSPRVILEKQSNYLAARTSGLVEGRINVIEDKTYKTFYTRNLDGVVKPEFIQSYSLFSSTLGYMTRVFLVVHSITLYPAVIVIEDADLFKDFKQTGDYRVIDISSQEKALVCPDMDIFTVALGDVLKLPAVSKIVNSLIAQSVNI